MHKRIFFLAIDNNSPSGGRKFIYHLVDILNSMNFEAYALHQKRNFRYTWFDNSTAVCYTYQIKLSRLRINSFCLKNWLKFLLTVIEDFFSNFQHQTKYITIKDRDILVLPETRMSFFSQILPGISKIILSQNPYFLLKQYNLTNEIHNPDLKAWIVMSKLNYDLMNFIFPRETKIYQVPLFIDNKLYNYSLQKKRQIAYMPRRLNNDSVSLVNVLKLRNNIADFSFLPIDNMTQKEVARVLKESLIFLSFSHREGFGLPPAEAMACGCIVIGYSGNGGNEFF